MKYNTFFQNWCSQNKLTAVIQTREISEKAAIFECKVSVDGYSPITTSYANDEFTAIEKSAREFLIYLVHIGKLQLSDLPWRDFFDTPGIDDGRSPVSRGSIERRHVIRIIRQEFQYNINMHRMEHVRMEIEAQLYHGDPYIFGNWTFHNALDKLRKFVRINNILTECEQFTSDLPPRRYSLVIKLYLDGVVGPLVGNAVRCKSKNYSLRASSLSVVRQLFFMGLIEEYKAEPEPDTNESETVDDQENESDSMLMTKEKVGNVHKNDGGTNERNANRRQLENHQEYNANNGASTSHRSNKIASKIVVVKNVGNSKRKDNMRRKKYDRDEKLDVANAGNAGNSKESIEKKYNERGARPKEQRNTDRGGSGGGARPKDHYVGKGARPKKYLNGDYDDIAQGSRSKNYYDGDYRVRGARSKMYLHEENSGRSARPKRNRDLNFDGHEDKRKYRHDKKYSKHGGHDDARSKKYRDENFNEYDENYKDHHDDKYGGRKNYRK